MNDVRKWGNSDITISVVVPVYNVEDYLRKCIDSLVNQIYTNIEIILVNDGSTDSSGTICDEYAQKDQRIRVIHKKNEGLVSARKAGVLDATGEFITYVDSDDWIDKEAYSELIEPLTLYCPDIIAFGLKKEYPTFSIERKEIAKEGFYSRDKYVNEVREYIKSAFFYSPTIGSALYTKLFKARLLKKYQLGVDNEICRGEDAAVTFPFLWNAKSLYITRQCFYHYRVRKSSIMWSENSNAFFAFEKLVTVLKNSIDNLGIYKEFWKEDFINIIYFQLILSIPDSLIKDNSKMLLFPEVKKNDDIVIFGKGVLANNLIKAIKATKFCNIIACLDRDDAFHIKQYTDNYQYIIVAITDHMAIAPTISLLNDLEVNSDKILYIKKENLTIDNLPIRVKNILNKYL